MTSRHWATQPRVPAGNPDGGQWTDKSIGKATKAAHVAAGAPEVMPASVSNAAELIKEWEDAYGEMDSPFWPDPGDGKYVVVRDSGGKLIAGATVHQQGLATFIDSIRSRSPGAGVEILDYLKGKNIFLKALASTEESVEWFTSHGFRLELNRPYEYNVIWVKR